MYQLVFSKRFERDLKKLVDKKPALKIVIQNIFITLITDPDIKSLRLHKLSGASNWSITVTMNIRIIASLDRNIWYLLRVGVHDEVY